MILKDLLLSIGAIGISTMLVGCDGHSEAGPSSSTNETNFMDQVPPELKTNPEAQSFLKSLIPEINRNKRVQERIKAAVATNSDVKVQAFHEFLSHWNLQWPVVKKGAVGEGGIGFAWYGDLNKFQGGVGATAVVEGRYIFECNLDFDMSADYRDVTFTKLRFSFGEVKELQPRPGGSYTVYFNTQTGKWLDLQDWERLKAANWDFSSIGINVISNAPIPHIHEVYD